MPTEKKEQLVAQVRERLQDSSAFYLVTFSGLTVGDMNALRGQVLGVGGELQVIKNRLLKLALAEDLVAGLTEYLRGPTMVAYCSGDPIGPAQVLARFATGRPGLQFRAGVVEGRVVDGDQAARIAMLPPREQILAEALGALSSPVSSLVGVLTAAIAELVYVMEAAVEKQQAG